MMRRLTSVILTFLFLTSVPVFGQGTRGSLTGIVQDPNGAAILKATVTAKQAGTNEEFKAETNSQGVFNFPSLPPGKYSVTIESSGFKKTELTEVIIEVGQPARVDIALEVGAVTEQVTVTGTQQEVINTTSPTLSKTINSKQVQDLPLLSRNPLDLARLQAGLAVNGTDVRNASVQGLRGNATNVTQDGINAMDNFVKGSSFFAISSPSLNATSEFSITVGTVGSDAGRGVAQVTLVTPSGSNSLHGGVFYQHRNDFFNANSFFNNATGTERPVLNQHFFGVQSSGPVWIPKVYDGRNKSFWFFSYEGFRENFNATRNRTVLTEDARKGIFRYVGANGAIQTINLLTLGNFHTINPLTAAQLNAMPAANNELVGDQLNTAGFRYNVLGTDPSDRYNGRFDQQLWDSEKWGSHKFEFTYHHGDFLLTPDTFNGLEAPFPGGDNAFQASQRVLWSAAVHSTFGAHMTNEARVGRQYAPVGFIREPAVPSAPFINLGSVTDYDNTFMSQGRDTALWQGVDNFSLVKGAHTFRMGADVQSVGAISTNDAGINPTVNIGVNSANPDGILTTAFPNLPAAAAGTAITDRAKAIYRDLVGSLGSASATFNITSPSSGFVPGATRSREFLYRDVSFYFQDAWKVKRNLTFNYGLRYEFLGVPTLPDGLGIQLTNFNDIFGVGGAGNLFNPNSTAGNPSATLDFVSGTTGKGLYKNDWNNFAPFIGFAYSPNFESGPLHWIFGGEGRSSIRAGYSISYLRDGFTVVSNALGTGTTNPGLIATAANNTPVGVLGPGGVPLVTPVFKIPITSAENFTANSGNGLWAFDPNLRTPYVQQWSIGIEREITSNMAIEVRYAANHAIKIFRALDYNETNIFENGFLQEFLNAQKNLAANGNSSFAPGATGIPLPIFTKLFTGIAAGSGFGNSGFISNLQQNNIGGMVNTLAFSTTYRANRALLPPAFFVTNPNAAFARVLGNFSYSKYHSLQIELRRRFSAGLQFQANYTLARTLNDGTGTINNQSTLESSRTLRNFGLDYQNSDQDQRHRFVANVVYDLPFGTGRRYLSGSWAPIRKAVEGWTMGTIVTYQTSEPFYITSGRSSYNSFNAGNNSAQLGSMTFEQFKSQLGVFRTPVGIFFINPTNLNITTQTNATTGKTTLASAVLKPGIFVQPAAGTFGNFPMNSLFGPNFTQTDFTLAKRTYFSERGNVELRMTVFNLFNHPNFTIGNISFDSTNFGRINSTRGQVREISFNLGVNW
ncbi:MAG TPA: carboxypeptidase-like regulatory domain-containing protein [Blastocatellia bacterium]|nr:carboxypeptidase-like regulatory domain-containing protein [Blastocatellia bacterium]